MPKISKSLLTWHSPAQMFALVTATEDYPKFMPWCTSGKVHERSEQGAVAELGIGFGPIQQSFCTRNTYTFAQGSRSPQRIDMALVSGPFKSLTGVWNFVDLTASDSATHAVQGCRISFDLEYELSSSLLAGTIAPVLEKLLGGFVDAFVQRAGKVYG